MNEEVKQMLRVILSKTGEYIRDNIINPDTLREFENTVSDVIAQVRQQWGIYNVVTLSAPPSKSGFYKRV